ncbi:MAG: hypothetical protein P9L98_05840 [Candidatus Kaelpia imicola]|nr:hypothetical protein [Candidatus Kaelpia imicola]
MKKIAISIAIFISIAAISGYLYLQKQLLPNAIVSLEKYLSENTPYNFKIEKPSLAIFRVIFPKIEMSYQRETIFIYNLSIRPNLTALINKQGEFTGSGIVQIDKYKLNFNIIDSVYDIKTKDFLLSIETSKEPIEKLLNIVSEIENVKLLDQLKDLEGTCKITLFLRSTSGKDMDLKINLYAKHLKLNLPNLKLVSSEVNTDYILKNKIPSLIVSVNSFSLLDIKENKPIIEKGSLTAETDLEKIEITDLKFINDNIIWQGTAEITNLKMHPTLNFNIVSELFHSVGEIKKISNAINFKTSVYKNKSMLHVNGHYEIDTQDLQLAGKGSTDIKRVLGYMDIPKDSRFGKIGSNIEIEHFNLEYNIKDKGLTADAYLVLSDTSYDKNIIAKSGSIDLKVDNKNILIENLYLGDRTSSIQAMGNFTIENQIPFKLDIYIRNYEVKKLIQPFFDKDIGNALLFANSAIKGHLKDLGSMLGTCKWEFREGNLGRFKFLSQIASLINRPELSEISFTQGKGSLSFQEEILQSPESIFISDYVNLVLSGAINTAGNLDLTLITEFPQEENAEEVSSSLGKIGEILSIGIQELFHKIKITGTIKNPKYTLIPASVNRILQNLIFN